jgi:hypothetical protein
MKTLNGKNYHTKDAILKTIRSICIESLGDVASYCDWVIEYGGPDKLVIEGVNLGISHAIDSVIATDEPYMNTEQLIILMRSTLHYNVDFNVRKLMEGCKDDIDIDIMIFLENEGILICIEEIKELDHYYKVKI